MRSIEETRYLSIQDEQDEHTRVRPELTYSPLQEEMGDTVPWP
jgi:hypothetical protein